MFKKRLISVTSIIIILILLMQMQVFAGRPPKSNLLEAPTGLFALSVTQSSIQIEWSEAAGAAGYYVYRATPNDGNYIQIAKTSGTSYKDTSLASGASYWYYVKAYNKRTTSSDSVHINVYTNNIITPQPTPTPEPVGEKEVLGFTTYYYSGDKSSYNSIVNNQNSITGIATHTYITDGFGNLTGLVPVEQITYANNNGITTLAMVSNNFSGSVAKELLESKANRDKLIANIQAELLKYGYKGVCIDLEGVYAANRSQLTIFINELYSSLNPQGYIVTAAVPAKTSDNPTHAWSGAYDYSAIAQNVDKLMLMTYDEHYPGGTAGPVASINWVAQVVDYAITVVPKEKLLLGIAAYGYDWSTNGTKAYSLNGIYNLASINNAEIKWDVASQCPYFTYTDSSGVFHEVWFENSSSIAYKLELVNSRDLAGIGIWRLGLENADYWNTVNSKLNK